MTTKATVHHLHADRGAAAWEGEVEAFFLHLRAARRSPNTLRNYTAALTRFRESIEARGRSLDPTRIERRDVEAFILHLADTGHAPSAQVSRFIVVRGFFNWLEAEGVVARSPFRGVPRPKAPEAETPVLTPEDIGALLATCKGRTFIDRRDLAILLLMLDAGLRRSEVIGLMVEDVRLPIGEVTVHGKGEKVRIARFGDVTAAALSRYMTRARADHPAANRIERVGDRADNTRSGHPLWLGAGPDGGPSVRGGMNGDGLYRLIERRALLAGIGRIHPHQFRHTWADGVLAAGMEEGDVVNLGGWSSRDMLKRYGGVRAGARARANYRSPVDQLGPRAKGPQ